MAWRLVSARAQDTNYPHPTARSAAAGRSGRADASVPPRLDEPSLRSATTDATWRGGPWDGVTMTVVAGERFFPLYGAAKVDPGETAAASTTERRQWQCRLCPILPGPDGSLIVDWHAATFVH